MNIYINNYYKDNSIKLKYSFNKQKSTYIRFDNYI